MGTEIDVAYVDKFSDDVHDLAQQKQSKLMVTVRDDVSTGNGGQFFFDRLGLLNANEVVGRHSDTILTDPPHSRRLIVPRDFDVASMLDKADKRRIIAKGAFDSKYARAQVYALNRKTDDLIIAAGFADAISIDEDRGQTTVPLPAAQKVLAGGTALLKQKILDATLILDNADVDEDLERFAVVSPKGIQDLLNDDEVVSNDFNVVKALVNGEINTWLGYTWIKMNRLPLLTPGGDVRRTMFFAQGAIGIAKPASIETSVDKRPDKRNGLQILSDFSMDGTRIEEALFVEVQYDETASVS
ncbi:MAG: phage capsid protein [Nitrospinaceae bacterium]